MSAYDSDHFNPPAPVATVTFRHPATGASLSNIPMLIDTGADVTLIPRDVIEKLGITPTDGKAYELQGFDGSLQIAQVVQVELIFLGKKFKGQFLVIDQPVGILGRNILNAVVLLFDGPGVNWVEYKLR